MLFYSYEIYHTLKLILTFLARDVFLKLGNKIYVRANPNLVLNSLMIACSYSASGKKIVFGCKKAHGSISGG